MALANTVRRNAIPIHVLARNRWEILRDLIGDSEVVMIGEGSHGTEDFYQTRADITKALISEKGFNFVAIEGDWPPAYRLHRWIVHGSTEDKDAMEALSDFQRFPKWMWRNGVVLNFANWLREFNASKAEAERIGFYGLDLYSLFESADAVIEYLKKKDPEAAKRAIELYGTLDQFREEPSDYGASVMLTGETSEDEVTQVLTDLLKKKMQYVKNMGYVNGEEYFYTVGNAKLVKNAEEYYRNTYMGGVKTWNLRDSHMFSTLDDLMTHYREKFQKNVDPSFLNTIREKVKIMSIKDMQKYLEQQGVNWKQILEKQELRALVEKHMAAVNSPIKIKAVIWAHNSHLGDAKATAMSHRRELNLGQIVRERYGKGRSYNIGLTSNEGTVRAARSWGGASEVMTLNPALKGSYEELFHHVGEAEEATGVDVGLKEEITGKLSTFALAFRSNGDTKHSISNDARQILVNPRLQRFIGVQYVKRTERESHYYSCNLPHQFDSVIHFDSSTALKPLDQ